MQTITRTRDRIIVAILLVILILAAMNALLGWGLFGDMAKGVALVVALVTVAVSRLLTPGVTIRTIFDARQPEAAGKADDPDVGRDSDNN
jgi:hypothetical protein